jgi:hypothetical protein
VVVGFVRFPQRQKLSLLKCKKFPAIVTGKYRQMLEIAGEFCPLSAHFAEIPCKFPFQKDLAEIDQNIAKAQQSLATDRYDITVHEKQISKMSATNASDVFPRARNLFACRLLSARSQEVSMAKQAAAGIQ